MNCTKINVVYLACDEWNKSVNARDDTSEFYHKPLEIDVNVNDKQSEKEDIDLSDTSNNSNDSKSHGKTAENVDKVLR